MKAVDKFYITIELINSFFMKKFLAYLVEKNCIFCGT